MKKKIILYSPVAEDVRSHINKCKGVFFPPLGLLKVAQSLHNRGYVIKFFDGNYNEQYIEELIDYTETYKDSILFIGFYLALLQIKDFYQIIEKIKEINKDISIVVGGPFASAFTKVVIENDLIDICCKGDGAEVSIMIAERLEKGASLKGVPNVYFKENEKIIENVNGYRDVINENTMIYYENFIELEDYVNKFGLYLSRDYDASIKRALPILTGLGCSFKCSFCENALLNHKHLSLSAEQIIDQIEHYHKKYNIDSFAFFDEDFLSDKIRFFTFIELMQKKDFRIKWGIQGRANYFSDNYITSELLKKLEDIGCVRIAIGVESGSPVMLKKLKKGITREQVIKVAEIGKSSSIFFSYSFIVNLPDETNEDILLTFDLIDKITSIKKNSFVSAVHQYFAYPGTPLSIEAQKKYGFNIEEKFNLKDFANFTNLEDYNRIINPRSKDMVRTCIFNSYNRLKIPFEYNLKPRSMYMNFMKIIALMRRKFNFYNFPIEVYFIEWLKKSF